MEGMKNGTIPAKFSPKEEHKKAEEYIQKLKNEIDGRFNDIFLCKKLLSEIKILLTSFPSCAPSPPVIYKEELLLARECMELGVLSSVKNRDGDSFERHIKQLHPYYLDYHKLLSPSEREFMIKGMYLLHLLAGNRLGEFHIYLQQIPIQDRSNEYILEAIDIEENLMDGNYTKIFELKKNKNKNANKIYMYDDFFIENLFKSVRQKIAFCLENSCRSIDVNLAQQKLFLSCLPELKSFADEENNRKIKEEEEAMSGGSSYSPTAPPLHASSSFSTSTPSSSAAPFSFFSPPVSNIKLWQIEQNKLRFVQKNEEKKEIPALHVIHQLIGYATELERIV